MKNLLPSFLFCVIVDKKFFKYRFLSQVDAVKAGNTGST